MGLWYVVSVRLIRFWQHSLFIVITNKKWKFALGYKWPFDRTTSIIWISKRAMLKSIYILVHYRCGGKTWREKFHSVALKSLHKNFKTVVIKDKFKTRPPSFVSSPLMNSRKFSVDKDFKVISSKFPLSSNCFLFGKLEVKR